MLPCVLRPNWSKKTARRRNHKTQRVSRPGQTRHRPIQGRPQQRVELLGDVEHVGLAGTMCQPIRFSLRSRRIAHVRSIALPELRRPNDLHYRVGTTGKRARPPGFFLRSLANATRGQRGGTPNNNSSRKRKISLTGSRALLSGVPTLSAVSVRPGCSRTQTVQNRPPALVYSTENRRPGCLPRSVRVTSIGQIPVRIVAWTSYARKRTLGHHLMRPDGRPW